MEITSPRYMTVQGQPILELTIDGTPHRFDAEQKPVLVRHGLVALEGHTSTLPDGTELPGVVDAPELFRWVTAFGLRCYDGSFTEGEASDEISPADVDALGQRLSDFAMDDSPPWSDVAAALR